MRLIIFPDALPPLAWNRYNGLLPSSTPDTYQKTQFGILMRVCKRFCLYKRKNGYVTTNVYNKTNVQMRLITFPDALPLR